jgi:hypothetical protein
VIPGTRGQENNPGMDECQRRMQDLDERRARLQRFRVLLGSVLPTGASVTREPKSGADAAQDARLGPRGEPAAHGGDDRGHPDVALGEQRTP